MRIRITRKDSYSTTRADVNYSIFTHINNVFSRTDEEAKGDYNYLRTVTKHRLGLLADVFSFILTLAPMFPNVEEVEIEVEEHSQVEGLYRLKIVLKGEKFYYERYFDTVNGFKWLTENEIHNVLHVLTTCIKYILRFYTV